MFNSHALLWAVPAFAETLGARSHDPVDRFFEGTAKALILVTVLTVWRLFKSRKSARDDTGESKLTETPSVTQKESQTLPPKPGVKTLPPKPPVTESLVENEEHRERQNLNALRIAFRECVASRVILRDIQKARKSDDVNAIATMLVILQQEKEAFDALKHYGALSIEQLATLHLINYIISKEGDENLFSVKVRKLLVSQKIFAVLGSITTGEEALRDSLIEEIKAQKETLEALKNLPELSSEIKRSLNIIADVLGGNNS